MNFLEVLKAASETGRSFRRATWTPSRAALSWLPGDPPRYDKCVWSGDGSEFVCWHGDVFADDWELVPAPPKTMSFMEAVKHMRRGCRVRRLAWSSLSLKITDGAFALYSDRIYTDARLLVKDVEVDDWVVIEDDTR